MKLPVERESCQLALQPHVDATVFLSRQRDLNLVFSLAADSRQAGLNHLTQVSEEGFDWGSQTPVKLLMMENKNVFIKHGFLLIWLLRTVRIKISAGYLFTFVHTCAYLCSALDDCCVHPLLPHTVHVGEQDMVRRLTEPALGQELAPTDAHGKPGTPEEDVLSRCSASLHRGKQDERAT